MPHLYLSGPDTFDCKVEIKKLGATYHGGGLFYNLIKKKAWWILDTPANRQEFAAWRPMVPSPMALGPDPQRRDS